MSTDQIGSPSGKPPTGDAAGSTTSPPADAAAETPAGAETPTSPEPATAAETATSPETPTTEAATAADAVPDVATTPDRTPDRTPAPAAAGPTGMTPGDTPADPPPTGPVGMTPGDTPAGPPPTGPAGVPPVDPDDLAQPGGPADRPKKKWPLAARVAIAVLSALVTLALINGGKSVLRSLVDKDHINNVAAGDCLRESRTDRNSPYRIVGCADGAATHKALAVVDGTGDSCIHVAGATRSVTNRAGNVCLGPKDVDPAKAVNVAKEGDCLGQNGDEAQRVDCSGADAEYTVLKRIVAVPAADTKTACDDVPGAVGTYSWDWDSELTANILPGVVDVLLCLGEK